MHYFRCFESEKSIISLIELKNYLRIDHDFDENILKKIIHSSTIMIENYLEKSLCYQQWRCILPSLKSKSIFLKFGPIERILSIQHGNKFICEKDYTFNRDTSVINFKNVLIAEEQLTIEYMAGGDVFIDENIRQALLILSARQYEDRIAPQTLFDDKTFLSLLSFYKKAGLY